MGKNSFKYSVTTTFDNSISYVEDFADARKHVKDEIKKDNKLDKSNFKINKL